VDGGSGDGANPDATVVKDAGQPTDSAKADGASPTDLFQADVSQSGPPIVISEIMANPAGVSDANGEWFELYNNGPSAVDLAGWSIRDQPGTNQNSHTIAASLVINPGQHVVLAANGSTTTNGGVTVHYVYGANWFLNNSEDEIYLYDASSNLIDKVEYSAAKGFTIPSGASISLKNPTLDNNNGANWCAETTTWTGGTSGDKASPGALPVCQ
jgi:hypothetical protein